MTVAVKRTLCYATEARLLASLRHRNIIRFYGACTTAPDFFLGATCVLMYCSVIEMKLVIATFVYILHDFPHLQLQSTVLRHNDLDTFLVQ